MTICIKIRFNADVISMMLTVVIEELKSYNHIPTWLYSLPNV